MSHDLNTQFRGRVESVLDGLEGSVGVAARDFGTGKELSYQPDAVFPTASTFKVPLLYALYRLAEAGEIDLQHRMVIEAHHRVPGSGVLQDLDPGIAPTIRDLAVLMTTVSDNLATDLLYDLVGRERLAAELARLDLTQTSIPFGCRGIFCHATGLDPDDAGTTYDALRDALKNGPRNMGSIAYAADARNDTSSPADMVAMLAAIESGDGISATSREAMIDILKRQKYNTMIPLHLPEETDVAHKTGSLRGIRCDVGIVYAPTGPYAIALMAKELTDEVEGTHRLAELSKVVWETFVGDRD